MVSIDFVSDSQETKLYDFVEVADVPCWIKSFKRLLNVIRLEREGKNIMKINIILKKVYFSLY